MNSKLATLGAIGLIGVTFVAVNMIAGAGLRSARIDATEGRLFTLTKGSRSVARLPDEPIDLTFYFSRKLAQGSPTFSAYGTRVREMLEEYARASNGKIRLKVVEPEPFSDEEDAALAAGLTGLPAGAAGENLYFGLAGSNSIDTRETIPIFDPQKESFLEYDLSRLIYSLASPTKPIIGLITPLPMVGGFAMDPRTRQPSQTEPWRIMSEMQGLFEVRPLGADPATIPDDIGVLWIVHPKGLSEGSLYAVDQFIVKGGRALIFVDPLCESDEAADPRNQMAAGEPRNSELTKLFDVWGIEVVPDRLAADREAAVRVTLPGQTREAVPYVAWMQLGEKTIDRGDAVTGQLSRLTFATSGVLRKKAPVLAEVPGADAGPPSPESTAGAAKGGATNSAPGVELDPLVTTGTDSMLISTTAIGLQPDPKTLMASFVSGNEKLTLAARVTGTVKSAFPAGKPVVVPTEGEAPPPAMTEDASHSSESTGPINVIVVADVDCLADTFWSRPENFFGQIVGYRKFADNGDFAANALDNLSGSSDLIGIRARDVAARPFTLVERMRRDAEAVYLTQQQLLQTKLADTQSKIRELQAARGDSPDAIVLSPEQEAEVEKFQAELVSTRKELRGVQLNLNRDIESLGTRLKLLNIGAMPVLVAAGALMLAGYRASRRRRTVDRLNPKAPE